MIVIPMGIETLTFGPVYKYLLGGNAVNAMLFAGVFFVIAALLAMRLNIKKTNEETTLEGWKFRTVYGWLVAVEEQCFIQYP